LARCAIRWRWFDQLLKRPERAVIGLAGCMRYFALFRASKPFFRILKPLLLSVSTGLSQQPRCAGLCALPSTPGGLRARPAHHHAAAALRFHREPIQASLLIFFVGAWSWSGMGKFPQPTPAPEVCEVGFHGIGQRKNTGDFSRLPLALDLPGLNPGGARRCPARAIAPDAARPGERGRARGTPHGAFGIGRGAGSRTCACSGEAQRTALSARLAIRSSSTTIMAASFSLRGSVD
jgi:hypothetical protein